MAFEVRLPKLSDEMTEATLSRWLKEVGDSVDKGEALVEVETEKVIVEVEAPRAGVLVEIVAAEQTVVPIDGLLCRIGAPGERAAPRQGVAGPGDAPASRAAPPQAPQAPQEPPAAPAPAPPPPAAAGGAGSNVVTMRQRTGGGAPVAASPLARRVADELQIDLTTVQGTGIGGKIVMADLQPYLAGAPGEAAPAGGGNGAAQPALPPMQAPAGSSVQPPTDSGFAEVPHTPLRRTIARRMSEAKGAIPHFYMTVDVDVTEVLALRKRLNEAVAEARIRMNDVLIKAVAVALEAVPALNATYAEGGVRRYEAVHVAFATAIDEGLVTPVVRDCHLKSIGRIAREAHDLAERARERTLAPDEMQGGTFTLSNLGMTEVVEFAAIINPPQVGILAVAKPVEMPVADHGRLVFRQRLRATLSADHRAVDGMTGAQFLAAFKAVLEHPERLLL